MYLLLSGEGVSDIGVCYPEAVSCEAANFNVGPMAVVIDQLVELYQGFDMSYIAYEQVGYVSESYLAESKQPSRRKSMKLVGKKRRKETAYYYENARSLAAMAKAKSEAIGDAVIAVLFRDSDGTASAGRGYWENKRDSMLEGFRAEKYGLGVAMIPKPKSEAWLLCAIKENPYQHCAKIEDASGNDNASNSLKQQLNEALGGDSSTETIKRLILDREIDVERIDMPSFNQFKADLEAVVRAAQCS